MKTLTRFSKLSDVLEVIAEHFGAHADAGRLMVFDETQAQALRRCMEEMSWVAVDLEARAAPYNGGPAISRPLPDGVLDIATYFGGEGRA